VVAATSVSRGVLVVVSGVSWAGGGGGGSDSSEEAIICASSSGGSAAASSSSKRIIVTTGAWVTEGAGGFGGADQLMTCLTLNHARKIKDATRELCARHSQRCAFRQHER
jgi:hypothetical protein